MSQRPTQHIRQGDCCDVMSQFEPDSISVCITDPPYNYEFIGHQWDNTEIQRRVQKAKQKEIDILPR